MAANGININTSAAADNSNTISISSSNIHSPKVRPPTWNQILRGGESGQQHPVPPVGDSPVSVSSAAMELIGSASPSREDGGAENGGGAGGRVGFNGDSGKRPAWKKPVAADAVVMGAESWPALSGKGQVVKTGSGLVSSNGISAMEQPASPEPPADSRASNPSPRDGNLRNEGLINSQGGNEHIQQHRNSFRNRNGGTHAHGDSHSRHIFGMRRDHGQGNHDWNHRNVNNSSRESFFPQQRGLPRYGRSSPPLAAAPFVVSARPFGGRITFPETYPYYIYTPFYPRIRLHMMHQSSLDFTVHHRILSQIDYYFSHENLVKDTYLRQKMDEQGWVPISLIATFRKVSQLTDSVQIILEALYHSTIVEVQGDKIRRRHDWKRWIIPTVNPFPSPSPRSYEIPNHVVATGIQSLTLEGRESSTGASPSQLTLHADASRMIPSGDVSMPGETGTPTVADADRDMAAVGTGQ